jgi:hypothetical protein
MQAASLVPMQGSVMMNGMLVLYVNSPISFRRCPVLTPTG